MTELEQYIQSYFGVSEEILQNISQRFVSQQLSKGAYFLEQGRSCERLSFVKSGMLRMFIHNEHKEITQWISTPGYFVTDLSSFLFGTPSRWNIQTLSDCEIYTITKSAYQQLGKELPQWHMLEKLFLAKCFATLEDRIIALLSMTAEERYEFFFSTNRSLFNQVPQQYLASMLGMTPETFSRIRKKQ
ncbi:MAG: Crp/Fnr family transcriptional regulator [Cytophagaceae bacterium]|jgi:CRP-like cAMP-binding protein|nr:Crp/Fnr family transcriptional regulator [Cytophagaceae bacterium]